MKIFNRLVMVIGVLLVLVAGIHFGYKEMDEHRAGKAAENGLEGILDQIGDSTGTESEAVTEAVTEAFADDETEESIQAKHEEVPEMPVIQVDGRSYIGYVSIPSIDRSLPVLSEWSDELLKEAPCRYTGSVYTNNLIIAGHNYRSHFTLLKEMQVGDEVYFTDADNITYSYVVDAIETIDQYDVEGMHKGDWDLSLFTCTTNSKGRVTLRCKKIK